LFSPTLGPDWAVTSGQGGMEFVKRLGADKVIDGNREDILKAAHEFAGKGLDTGLKVMSHNAERSADVCQTE
jgi:NADPH:quinone reductase-like Zn-dependent oxidoreductase